VSQPRNVAILIFDDVEVLDFSGPFEVFSVTGLRQNEVPFNAYTVGEKAGPVLARSQLSINPRYTILDCPPPDILLVPGGRGTRREMHNAVLIDWIKTCTQRAELVLSVCTGALLLARAGLLEGMMATTHHGALWTTARSSCPVGSRQVSTWRSTSYPGCLAGTRPWKRPDTWSTIGDTKYRPDAFRNGLKSRGSRR
jgi:transcriptional regulator GlxA family with amidase domain